MRLRGLGRRLPQYLHVKNSIFLLIQLGKNPYSLSFARLKTLLRNGRMVMEGVSLRRYTAMVKSVLKGLMDDTDVCWH